MATKRYGPTDAPGVVIIEKDAEKTIEKGLLGTTGYMGILERGDVLDDNGNFEMIVDDINYEFDFARGFWTRRIHAVKISTFGG